MMLRSRIENGKRSTVGFCPMRFDKEFMLERVDSGVTNRTAGT
jgi:hypothetical protein